MDCRRLFLQLPGPHAIPRKRRRRACRRPSLEGSVPALARRDGNARHHSGGAAGDPVDPSRPADDRDPGRGADRASAPHLVARRRSRLTADRTFRRDAHLDGGTRDHRAGGGQPRGGARRVAALPRDPGDGLRNCHHATGGADLDARMASAPHRPRCRGLYQRHDGRHCARPGAHHPAGAALGRDKTGGSICWCGQRRCC